MEFVELAALDQDRYIVYGTDKIATFNNDSITIINLDTLTKMVPDSDEFKEVLDQINQCLPHMLIRLADPEDIELYDDMERYFYQPTEIHGGPITDFINNLFVTNEPLKKAAEQIDKADLKRLADHLSEDIDNIEDFRRELKKLDKKQLKELTEDLETSPKNVYEINILDMIEKDSPFAKVVKETFDYAKDDKLRREIEPLFKGLLGKAYKTVHLGGKDNNILYVFTNPNLKRLKREWWPDAPMSMDDWKSAINRDSDFETTIRNQELRPRNARAWRIPIENLMGEEELFEIIKQNQKNVRGHEMKEMLEPYFKKELGTDYLDTFIEPGSHENRKLYVFMEPRSKEKLDEKWWPGNSISTEKYNKLFSKWEGFADLDKKYYGSGE